MKKILSFCGAVLAALFLCPVLQADSGHIVVDTSLPIPQPVNISSTWSVRTDGINWSSIETVITSASVAGAGTSSAVGFNDGSVSTLTITVSSYTALSTATATNSLTISSDTALVGQCVSGGGPNLGGFNVCNPGQFAVDLVYSSNTACNIANAIANAGVIVSTCGTSGSSVVTTSAPYGAAAFNNFQICSSSWTALTGTTLLSSSAVTGVGCGPMSGGQNAATISINGFTYTAFASTSTGGFSPVTSIATTAANLAVAITASSMTTGVIATSGTAGTFPVVIASATSVGQGTNYATASSSQSALTLGPYTSSSTVLGTATGFMYGGSNSSWTINTPQITSVSHGLSQGLAVYLTTGTNVALTYSTSSVGGTQTSLKWGTTIYAIPTGPNTFEISPTSTGAIAGQFVYLTSSGTKAGGDSFTFNLANTSGTVVWRWLTSNDNVNWQLLQPTSLGQPVLSSGTVSTYVSTGTVTFGDLGHMDYGYLGMNVNAPTTSGAVTVQTRIIGNAP